MRTQRHSCSTTGPPPTWQVQQIKLIGTEYTVTMWRSKHQSNPVWYSNILTCMPAWLVIRQGEGEGHASNMASWLKNCTNIVRWRPNYANKLVWKKLATCKQLDEPGSRPHPSGDENLKQKGLIGLENYLWLLFFSGTIISTVFEPFSCWLW